MYLPTGANTISWKKPFQQQRDRKKIILEKKRFFKKETVGKNIWMNKNISGWIKKGKIYFQYIFIFTIYLWIIIFTTYLYIYKIYISIHVFTIGICIHIYFFLFSSSIFFYKYFLHSSYEWGIVLDAGDTSGIKTVKIAIPALLDFMFWWKLNLKLRHRSSGRWGYRKSVSLWPKAAWCPAGPRDMRTVRV